MFDVFTHFCCEKAMICPFFLPGRSRLHDPAQIEIATLSAAQFPGFLGVAPGAARDDVQPDVAQTPLHRSDGHGTHGTLRVMGIGQKWSTAIGNMMS